MNAISKDKRLKIVVFVAFVVCGVLFPVAFYYGIYGILALVFAAVALQELLAAVCPSRDVCWGAGTMLRFRMSRISHLIVGLWLAFFAACLVIHGILKLPSSPYYFVGHAVFMLLVVATRWRDTGRFFR